MNHEQPISQPETINRNQPITELLPRYYEAYGDSPTYQIEESMILDGHEVAWMRYEGVIKVDIMKQGREGTPYVGHELFCACHFTEDVGWREDERGPIGLSGRDRCDIKKAVVGLQQLRVHDVYQEAGMLDDLDTEGVKTILLDLIEKSKEGIFLEGHSGANFWGGYYYLQTAAAIIGISMEEMWPAVYELQKDKRIRLEGMVVQECREQVPVETQKVEETPEPTVYYEKPEKVWALVPQPGRDMDLDKTTIDATNQWLLIGQCVVGLSHEPELAKRRLEEALAHPRVSRDRLYQMSFVEPEREAGALAVIAYTALNSDQPEEWVVEGFVGDDIVPEIHTLSMDHPTVFGIDVEDQAKLNQKIEEWWPEN